MLISEKNANDYMKFPSKNIVICCDGTANEYALDIEHGLANVKEINPNDDGDMNTNVVKLFGYLKKNTPKTQVAYYDPGVGTWGGKFKKKAEQAIGIGITRNIKEAYRFLMDRYYEGDTIFLFGFSRGAYTVRSLAGFINKCGLLTRGSENLVDYAYELYTTKNNSLIAEGFKQNFSRPCQIYFIGIWDTVAALAPPLIYHAFHDATLNENVNFAYQALALDEQRSSFKPIEWDSENFVKTITPTEKENTPILHLRNDLKLREVEQVWFSGVHSDIGGSYRDDRLSKISLAWILEKAVEAGLELEENIISEIKSKSSALGLMHDERKNFPFWILPPQNRNPTKGAIHPSVFEREKNMNDYKVNNPNNLKMYYEV